MLIAIKQKLNWSWGSVIAVLIALALVGSSVMLSVQGQWLMIPVILISGFGTEIIWHDLCDTFK